MQGSHTLLHARAAGVHESCAGCGGHSMPTSCHAFVRSSLLLVRPCLEVPMLHRPPTRTSHGDPFQGLQTRLSAYETRVL